MKRLNRKGFTLVELLVVLVILVVIMAIAIPSVTSSMERSKQKQYDSKIELLESAAEIYVDRHKNSVGSNCIITVEDLVCDNLVTKEQAKDPFNEKETIDGYYSCMNNKWDDSVNGYTIFVDENLICE